MVKILSGKELAEKMRQEMKSETDELKMHHNLVPGLAVVLIGDNPASLSYVKGKEKACAQVGILSREYKFDADYKEEQLLKLIRELNNDPSIHGILVQLPSPDHINEEKSYMLLIQQKMLTVFIQ